ncbi:MAG: metallophosphoesterase family protein [Gemmatimonadaceae bacterium]
MGLIGLISDTHGLVRPSVFTALQGVDLILHAGDVGDGVLTELGVIAPVRAVAGNTDPPGILPPALDIEIEGIRIHVSHGNELGIPTPEKLQARYSADVIVYGHTHRQLVLRADSRWVVNPGAAGHRRFKLLPSVGLLRIAGGAVDVEIIELDPNDAPEPDE